MGPIRVARGAQVLLLSVMTCILLSTAVAKIVWGRDPKVLLSASAFYGLAGIEVVVAACLWTRYQRLLTWLVAVGCVAGILMVFFWPSQKCGCVGAGYNLTPKEHAALLAVLGTAATGLQILTRLSMTKGIPSGGSRD